MVLGIGAVFELGDKFPSSNFPPNVSELGDKFPSSNFPPNVLLSESENARAWFGHDRPTPTPKKRNIDVVILDTSNP